MSDMYCTKLLARQRSAASKLLTRFHVSFALYLTENASGILKRRLQLSGKCRDDNVFLMLRD